MKMSIVPVTLAVVLVLSSGVPAAKQGKDSPGSPRVVSLVVAPAQVDASQKGYRFLPFDDGSRQDIGADAARKGLAQPSKAAEPTPDNGVPFYNKAAEGLPAQPDTKQLSEWMKLPLQDLPKSPMPAALQGVKASLDAIRQGARCKSCNWPAFVPGTAPAHLSQYRQLAFLLCLKARLEVAQGQYDQAVETIGTGLAMAKHIGEAPTLIQGMTAVAMASLLLRPLEDLAQVKGSPNLYVALRALPRPLIDIEVPISSELKNLDSSKQFNAVTRGAMRTQLEESHKKVRLTTRRFDSDVAAWQCIEALRHYAALHQGQLPKQISDVKELTVPADVVSGKPFEYRLEGAKAILETAIPMQGTAQASTRYEITVAR